MAVSVSGSEVSVMAKKEFSTPQDEQFAKQLREETEAQWRDWQMELLVLANLGNWESLKELIRRGPTTAAQSLKGPVV